MKTASDSAVTSPLLLSDTGSRGLFFLEDEPRADPESDWESFRFKGLVRPFHIGSDRSIRCLIIPVNVMGYVLELRTFEGLHELQ